MAYLQAFHLEVFVLTWPLNVWSWMELRIHYYGFACTCLLNNLFQKEAVQPEECT